jgi:hypothetical protein
MLSLNNEHFGYLVWLDFTRNEDVDLLTRPQILPYIPSEKAISDDPSCKKLIEAAKITASVASSMVYDWTHNTIDKDKNMGRSISDATSDFQRKVLHVREYNWYNQRSTWQDVISISKFYMLV